MSKKTARKIEPPPARVPCPHCKGSGVVPTMMERWGEVSRVLAAYGWNAASIEAIRAKLEPAEALYALRPLSVEVVAPGGSRRVFFKWVSPVEPASKVGAK